MSGRKRRGLVGGAAGRAFRFPVYIDGGLLRFQKGQNIRQAEAALACFSLG